MDPSALLNMSTNAEINGSTLNGSFSNGSTPRKKKCLILNAFVEMCRWYQLLTVTTFPITFSQFRQRPPIARTLEAPSRPFRKLQ